VIEFLSEDIEFPSLDIERIKKWIFLIIKNHDFFVGSISVNFCSDKYILKTNREFLNHDYYTDIITFDYCENRNISGDLLISLDTVLSNSKQYETSFLDELHRVIIHGILHLIGFDDKTSESLAIIREEENKSLSILETL
jgi:rRNA maturation RNase YbeY